MTVRLADKARLRWDKLENGYVLLYPERGLTLSESAGAILLKCDGTRTVEVICAELAKETSASLERLTSDVKAFLGDMQRRGLVVGFE